MAGVGTCLGTSPSAPALSSHFLPAIPHRNFAAPPHRFNRTGAPRLLRASIRRLKVLSSSDLGTIVDVACDKVVDVARDNVEITPETEIVEGCTMTQFCDKMIDFFLNKQPHTSDWRKFLVFRDDWKIYSDFFYKRCQEQADKEEDQVMKKKLLSLLRKMKKVDDEVEKHTELLKEIQQSPTDINAVITRRRKDFTADFFRYLNILAEEYDTLEDRDGISRLGAMCLSAVQFYDNAVANLDTVEATQSKFDRILNSPSLEAACEKIKCMAKAKELDSSLILLINGCWAAAKENPKMSDTVKNIMYNIYKTTQNSIESIAPKEVKLIRNLLDIEDPEERFAALATAFSPGSEHDAKREGDIFTTPKELHKWVKIVNDAYQLNKQETNMSPARMMAEPMIMQRLYILQQIIETEYLKTGPKFEEDPDFDS